MRVTFSKTKKDYRGNAAVRGTLLFDRMAQCDDLDHLTDFLRNSAEEAKMSGNDRAAIMVWNKRGDIVSHQTF